MVIQRPSKKAAHQTDSGGHFEHHGCGKELFVQYGDHHLERRDSPAQRYCHAKEDALHTMPMES